MNKMDKFFKLTDPEFETSEFVCINNYKLLLPTPEEIQIGDEFKELFPDDDYFQNQPERSLNEAPKTEIACNTSRQILMECVEHAGEPNTVIIDSVQRDIIEPIKNSVKSFVRDEEKFYVCRSRYWLKEHANDNSTTLFNSMVRAFTKDRTKHKWCYSTLMSAYKRLLYSDYLTDDEINSMNFIHENPFLPGFVYILQKSLKDDSFFSLISWYERKNRKLASIDKLKRINNLKLEIVMINNVGYPELKKSILIEPDNGEEPYYIKSTLEEIDDINEAKEACVKVIEINLPDIQAYVDEINSHNDSAAEVFKQYIQETTKKLERYIYNRQLGVFTTDAPDYFAILVHLTAIRAAVDNFEVKCSRKYKKYYFYQ